MQPVVDSISETECFLSYYLPHTSSFIVPWNKLYLLCNPLWPYPINLTLIIHTYPLKAHMFLYTLLLTVLLGYHDMWLGQEGNYNVMYH